MRFGVFPVPLDQYSYCVVHTVVDSKELAKFRIAVTVLKVVTLYCITLFQEKKLLRTSKEGSLVVVITWFGLDDFQRSLPPLSIL